MGCIFQDYDGICTMWNDGIEMAGIEGDGICVCSDDPDPSNLCELYETDNPDGADCEWE